MSYFIGALTQHYADFSGRARRREFWMFTLFSALATFLVSFVETLYAESNNTTSSQVLTSLYQLGVFIPSIAIAIRRMHDVGKSGWFMLIPIYNLILFCRNGTPGANSYGASPKAVTQQQAESPHGFCGSCGAPNISNGAYCATCGTALS